MRPVLVTKVHVFMRHSETTMFLLASLIVWWTSSTIVIPSRLAQDGPRDFPYCEQGRKHRCALEERKHIFSSEAQRGYRSEHLYSQVEWIFHVFRVVSGRLGTQVCGSQWACPNLSPAAFVLATPPMILANPQVESRIWAQYIFFHLDQGNSKWMRLFVHGAHFCIGYRI